MEYTIYNVKERQELKNTVIKDLYDYYFGKDKGEASNFKINFTSSIDYELYLAFIYLIDKGLLKITDATVKGRPTNKSNFNVIITVDGIDYVENVLKYEGVHQGD